MVIWESFLFWRKDLNVNFLSDISFEILYCAAVKKTVSAPFKNDTLSISSQENIFKKAHKKYILTLGL